MTGLATLLAHLVLVMMLTALPVAGQPADDAIRVGDTLAVTVWNQPAFSGAFVVDNDGAIAIPFLGRTPAAGLTLRDLEASIVSRLSGGFVRSPYVRIDIEQRAARVFVSGEVRRPGSFPLVPGLTIADALALAGWLTPSAGTEAEVLRGGVKDAPVVRLDLASVDGLAFGATVALADGDVVIVRGAPTVHVTGPVSRPGEYAIVPGAPVVELLARAGGLLERAEQNDITVVRSVDGARRETRAEDTTRLDGGDVVVVGERGPLRLKPRVGLVNVGYDSNIHHAAVLPQEDLVATVRGGLDASSQTPHLSVHATGTADYLYFGRYEDQRSVNVAANGRLEVPLGGVTPYMDAGYDRGLAREQFDMNRRLHRTLLRAEAGGTFENPRGVSLVASARHRRIDYIETASGFDDGDHSLDRTEDRLSMVARAPLTPLTALQLRVSGEHARFMSATERDATLFACVPGLVFGRDAALSGRANAGYEQVTFVEPVLPEYRGLVGDIALSRPISDRTRLTASALREFRYSADRASEYYAFSSAGGGFGRWITRQWRLDFAADYKWLRYDAVPGRLARTDNGYTATAQVGRRFDDTTFEIAVTYERRLSNLARERFTALLAGVSVLYAP